MRFSNLYPKLLETACFDPILVADTQLFVDPFSVFDETEGVFSHSFEKLIRFFNEGFKLAADGRYSEKSLSYQKLKSMMIFPEINELGLGYSNTNVGAGSSKHFCEKIVNAIFRSIDQGLTEYKHFEEIGIFDEGIGCDRISDITCNILKEEIIKYTQQICKLCNIPVFPVKMKHARFDFNNLRWIDQTVMLPQNKYKNNRGVLLIPSKFLNDLPTINTDSFRDYIWDNKNETLRNDLNFAIKRDIDKAAIIEIARNNPDWVRSYEDVVERNGYTPYNLKRDPKGMYLWAGEEVQSYVKSNPVECQSIDDFLQTIIAMCDEFKNFVENDKGYALLWDKDKPKPESAVQLLLYGITKSYCMAWDIDVSKESNSGSGPVDFKFSQGYTKRVLLETKLISNTRYWNGIEKQLPQYMLSEGIEKGIFMLVAYTTDEYNKANDFKKKVLSLHLPYDISIMIIDASSNKTSASKL